MQIYLPIAEMSVNILLILGMGGAVGFLSGLFGVGGGFVLTPLLIFTGIPPTVAVASTANQIIASSVSGVVAHWRRKQVDFKMGGILTAGGIAGALIGILIFKYLERSGQSGLVIALSYVVLLSTVGGLMLYESVGVILRARRGEPSPAPKSGQHLWIHHLPLRMRFRRSRLYISVIGPGVLGFLVGLMTTVMGVGGGFVLVPAMIYLLQMPTSVVIGTSLFQIIFVTASATLLHAVGTKSVDVVLSGLLAVGGVIGAQAGARFGVKLSGEQLRAMLAVIVLVIAIRLAYGLTVQPDEIFSLSTMAVGEP